MTDTYAQAQRARHQQLYVQRTAQTQAAFLLPHLRSGMALLDIGCGPCTITTGLAAAVAPGLATALDKAEALPEAIEGVTLVAGDARALPFPDASFDAIFASAMLQHVPEPLEVLREARRVARTGAVIGVVDSDWDGELMYPTNELLRRAHEVATLSREAAGTSPRVGRQLRALLTQAGFSRCVGFARVGCDADPDNVRRVAEFAASGYSSPTTIDRIVSSGWATADEMSQFAQAWRDWGAQPGAYLARLWCEAIGWAD
jgi:SAM-dependent methyltransferase